MSTMRVPELRGCDAYGFPDAERWASTGVAAHLVRAHDGALPRAATAFRVGRTSTALHVRFECGGDGRRCSSVRRGDPHWRESVVEVFVAAGDRTPAAYLEIEVSPAAAIFEAVVTNPEENRRTMRAEVRVVPGLVARLSRPRPGLWVAEIAVPWPAIAPEVGLPAALRANFFRIDRPADGPAEFLAWSPTLKDPPDFHLPSRFGRLVLG